MGGICENLHDAGVKVGCCFSAEFLIGPQAGRNVLDLGLYDEARESLRALGLDLDELLSIEEEPGLGRGALARPAAC